MTWNQAAAGSATEDAGWSRVVPWPHLVAQDIHIGNPASMTVASTDASTLPAVPTDMASAREFTFSLNPLALLNKRIVVPLLRFDSPDINLQRQADGKNNWSFTPENENSPWKLELKRVEFSKGSVHLVDAVKHADLTADVDTINADPNYGVSWKLRGKFNGETITGDGKAGAILSLQHQTAPYPILANLRVGHTAIAIEGTVTRPENLAAVDMRLKVSGVTMGDLYKLGGFVLPETPPFTTEGHLIGSLDVHGQHWIYRDFSGKVGSSDIGGTFDYRSKQPRPLLSGNMVSHLTQFSDLAPLIGADSNASKIERGASTIQPASKALPIEPFKTNRWTSIDADVTFSAEKIIWKTELPIKKLKTKLHLQDGVLSLSPLKFDTAGGNVNSDITLDGSGKSNKNAIKAEMKVAVRHLNVKQLFPAMQTQQASVGEINGDASLSAVGNSVASLLGASNGEVKALINQGTISKLLLEEMGLNIGSVIVTQLIGDKQVDLNCMAADFDVTNGLMQAHYVILDTTDAIINISGDVNLAQEQLDLTLTPNSKGVRVFSLRAPLYVRGNFTQPRVSVDKGVMAMRAGGALALAALTPVAAMIPLIKTGPGENSDCARLLVDAQVRPVARRAR